MAREKKKGSAPSGGLAPGERREGEKAVRCHLVDRKKKRKV